MRVKICCIASVAEARAAIFAGAHALGLVSAMPSGPGPIDDETARTIALATPPGVSAFLLTARTHGEAIADHAAEVAVPVVQIVRHIDPREHTVIRRALPTLKIVQVVHVEDPSALELARGYAITADALLLDSGRPGEAVEELGGTGRAHDWKISRQIVSVVDKPVWLAGGLTAFNVGEAIATVRPFGVDLCSGVRTLGKLDVRKLSAFMAAVRVAS